MNSKMNSLLNRQLQCEFESAYIYLEFASFFEDHGLEGFSHWFKLQASEEVEHGMKFFDYLHETKGTLELLDIAAPEMRYENEMDILKLSLAHEELVTSQINRIYTEAKAEDDYRTMNFLEWFISEQREEEKHAKELIDKYCLYASDGAGLYELNRELSGRIQ